MAGIIAPRPLEYDVPTDAEIRALFYLSDRKLAAHLGVTRDRVMKLRKKPAGERGASQGHISEPGILLAEANDRKACAMASDALNTAQWALYGKLADKHGLEHPLIAAVQFCGMRAA